MQNVLFELLTMLCQSLLTKNLCGVVFCFTLAGFSILLTLFLPQLKCSDLYFLGYFRSHREHKMSPTFLKPIINHWTHPE